MKEHKCIENQLIQSGVKILFGPEIDEDWQGWILQNVRFASIKDVEDGEAEIFGEVLCQQDVTINFCPFCGINLNNEKLKQ